MVYLNWKPTSLEKIKTIKLHTSNKPHTCANCSNQFSGKVCNQCGEKVFHPEQLSVKYFLHHTLDIFTHFENKVLKSIWLTLRKPGFITQQNLKGIRVLYAKPVQLFIVVNLIFYFFVSYLQRTDYTPTIGDGNGSWVSDRPGLGWVKPLDAGISNGLQQLIVKKTKSYDTAKFVGRSFFVYRKFSMTGPFQGYSPESYNQHFLNAYDQKASVFSKALIFLLIPVFALILYLVFSKRLKYFGAALNLATHFLTFNLLFYILLFAISSLPFKWSGSTDLLGLPFKATEALLYNSVLSPFSEAVFGIYGGFEALHIIFLGCWLFFAFKRLFGLHWFSNLIVSYLLARLFFLLIFSFYKKFLIALTLWAM